MFNNVVKMKNIDKYLIWDNVVSLANLAVKFATINNFLHAVLSDI